MSKKIADLVPPQELCKQIPEGAFVDSALVWERNIGLDGTEYDPVVRVRKDAIIQNIIAPAPTLIEIIVLGGSPMEYDVATILLMGGKHSFNITRVALEMWLEQKGINYEN